MTIISGQTGCGKTTLVPQFLLQQAKRRGEEIRIVVTQPRRIAAQSVAQRVADSMGVRLSLVFGVWLLESLIQGPMINFARTVLVMRWLTTAFALGYKDSTCISIKQIYIHDRLMFC